MSATKQVLVVFGGHAGGRTRAMVTAACEGIASCGEDVSVKALSGLDAGVEDLLGAQGLLLATPEHFGYMSGALKHFFDRTFYPVEGKVVALPYALLVSAGNDGAGTVSSVERIATGYRWKKIAEPIVARGELTPGQLERCRELGELLATGVAMELF
jgi:multimeric flavodoxin WrbA